MNCARNVVLSALLALACVTPAIAASCGDNGTPFQDVSQHDIFCSDATWARNAGVSVGCDNEMFPNFCPGNAATRAQMVSFLRRMAEATFPAVFMTESSAAPSGDLDGPGVNACVTGTIPALRFEDPPPNGDFLHATAVVSLLGGAGDADVQLHVSRSMNGPPFLAASQVGSVVTVPAGQWADATVLSVFTPNLQADTQWRIELSRAAGSATTGEIAGLRCQIKVVRSMAPIPPF